MGTLLFSCLLLLLRKFGVIITENFISIIIIVDVTMFESFIKKVQVLEVSVTFLSQSVDLFRYF